MKELSIEEKSKRYDEAIDKVAYFIKKHIGFGSTIHPNSSEAKELFNIFPELKESEDEKIRKGLLKMFNHYVKNNIELNEYGLDKDMVLAWLKSLKPQTRWKPSEEQMQALDWTLSFAYNCGEECLSDLRTLHEQLKKLRDK